MIEGGACNKSFVLDLLDQPEVVDGTGGWADTSWIDRVRGEGRLVAQEHSGVAVVAAAIEAYVDELRHRGRPAARDRARRPPAGPAQGGPAGRAQAARARRTTSSTVNTGPSRYRVTVAAGGTEQTVDVELDRIDEFHRRLVGRRAPPPRRHRDPRPEHPGRGRRRRPPGQPRRGRRAALARAGPGGRHPGRRSATEVEAGAPGAGAGVDEDGDGAVRAVRGPDQGAAGDHRQPGRDRRRRWSGSSRSATAPRRPSVEQDRPRPRPARAPPTASRSRRARRGPART